MKVPSAEFHSPPPSAPAELPPIQLLVISTAPAPVRCRPPPLPGSSPVEFLTSRVPMSWVSPSLASIAPPARVAVLRARRESEMSTLPPSLKTAPPEAPVPVTWLASIEVLRTTSSPLTRIAPPLSPAAGAPRRSRAFLTTRRAPSATVKTRSTPAASIV